MYSFKKVLLSVAAILTAGITAIVPAGCGKPSIVSTEEGEKLTAHAWETNYFTHSEVRFDKDGSMTVTVDNLGDMVDVPGSWSIDGTTLTTVIDKQYDENGELTDKKSTTTYTYADYMSDEIIDNGDEAISEIKEQHQNGDQWFISDKYLYFSGSVWVPKKS